jgi:hypothetical protein
MFGFALEKVTEPGGAVVLEKLPDCERQSVLRGQALGGYNYIGARRSKTNTHSLIDSLQAVILRDKSGNS